MFKTLTHDELALATGGGALGNMVGNVPQSTGLAGGAYLAQYADHPGKTLDSLQGALGIRDSCAPNSTYTPAAMNSTGGITQSSCTPPASSGPSPPISD